ncbi:MAG: phenylacetate--CoA ligase family protein, partial [Deltaproteobacteria bacterium]|nr:phenylacetate--CoA ligase family protein [Deltaproteobacteria bacterium]
MNSRKENIWNRELETLSTDALLHLHQEKFLKQLKYLFDSSPMYQEKFKKEGLAPGDIRSLEDIIRLPFTEKGELRQAQTSRPPVGRHRACTIEKLDRVYSSSGTT